MNNAAANGPLSPLFDDRESGPSPSLTKRDLLTILFKRKFVIVSCWVSITVLVAAALLYLPPTYVAEAKVLVKIEQQGRPSFLSGIAAYNEASDTEPANRKLETEMEVMLSRPLLEQVVNELELKPTDMYRPPYVHLLAPIARLIDWVKVDVLGFAPKPSRAFETTVDAFSKSLNVSPAKSKSGEATPNLILIRFQASTAATAHEGLQRLMLHYQHFSNELDQQNGERAFRIVEQRVSEAATAVARTQEEFRRFAAKVRPPGADMEPARPLTLTPDAASGRATLTTGQTSILRNRVAQLEIELAEQEQLFTSKVESVAALKEALAEARARLAAQTAESAVSSDEMLTLQRNMRLAEDHYLDLKRKLTQIGLFLEMNPNQVSSRVLVEPPRPPESSEWKKSVVIGLAASIAGLLFGLGAASLFEYADHRLANPRDVERHTGLPLLATIDMMDADKLRAFTGTDRAGTP